MYTNRFSKPWQYKQSDITFFEKAAISKYVDTAVNKTSNGVVCDVAHRLE
jgi:hypothetical protein